MGIFCDMNKPNIKENFIELINYFIVRFNYGFGVIWAVEVQQKIMYSEKWGFSGRLEHET